MTLDELCGIIDSKTGHHVIGSGLSRKARCPGHDDIISSLSIRETGGGKLLLKCFAGCKVEDIVEALAITMKDLSGGDHAGGREVCRYDYLGPDGKILYTKIRYEPKDFRCSPSGYRGPRVPYRLPDIITGPARKILWVEGEKDADRLRKEGFVATTAGGAQDWRSELTSYFVGRQVIIIPDNDEPGRTHARTVATALASVASSVAICELPGVPPKGDVSDWFALGKTRDDLVIALKNSVPFLQSALQDFESVPQDVPEWLWFPRIARGAITMVFGEAGIGKSTVVLDVLARLSRGDVMPQSIEKQPVTKSLIVGIEGPASRTREVLFAAGANLANVAVLRADRMPEQDKSPLEQMEFVEAQMRRFGATVLFVDNVSEVCIESTDSNNEFSVRAAMRKMTDFAERTGWAVILISHPKKGAAYGSVKEAITGSQAFTNLPRTTIFVAPIRDLAGDPTGTCGVAVSKSNLYALDHINTLEYELVSHESGWRDGHPVLSPPRVAWKGVCPLSAQQMLEALRPRKDADAATSSDLTLARSWMEGFLPSVPETGIAWSEVVLPPGVTERAVRAVRSEFLQPVGKQPHGVRWFPVVTPVESTTSSLPPEPAEKPTSWQAREAAFMGAESNDAFILRVAGGTLRVDQ